MILNSKNLLLTGVALAAFSLASVAAKAADAAPPVSSSPIYVSVFGGASFLNDVKASYNNITAYSVSTYPGYIIGAAIGYQWNDMVRTEIELSHSSWKGKNFSLGIPLAYVGPVAGSISATYLLGNLWIDIPTNSAFTPYVGGGLGVGFATADTTFNGNTYGYGPNGVGNFAYQVGAGVKFDLSESIAVDAGYRFKGITNVNFNDSDGGGAYNGANLNSHNVQIGLTFKF